MTLDPDQDHAKTRVCFCVINSKIINGLNWMLSNCSLILVHPVLWCAEINQSECANYYCCKKMGISIFMAKVFRYNAKRSVRESSWEWISLWVWVGSVCSAALVIIRHPWRAFGRWNDFSLSEMREMQKHALFFPLSHRIFFGHQCNI